METNERMDELFSRARTQAPKTSYEQTSKAFQVGLATLAGGGILTKWTALSLKFKFIIMTTAISIISVTSILVVSTLSAKNVEKEPKIVSEKAIHHSEGNDAPIEDTKQPKTIVFAEATSKKNQPNEKSTSRETHLPNLEILGLKMIPREINAFNRKLAPTSMIKQPTIAQDSLTMKLFEISEKTTNAEIEAIKQQAVAAGLEFDFATKVRQDKIKKLDLNMKKGSNKWMSKISGTDSFSFTFGWWEDAEGKYVKFICDDDLTTICGDCDQEVEDEDYWNRVAEMRWLCFRWKILFNIILIIGQLSILSEVEICFV